MNAQKLQKQRPEWDRFVARFEGDFVDRRSREHLPVYPQGESPSLALGKAGTDLGAFRWLVASGGWPETMNGCPRGWRAGWQELAAFLGLMLPRAVVQDA